MGAQNLFTVLDTAKNGSLQLKEIKPVFDVLIRRGAKIVMGFSWGLGMIVNRESKKIFANLMKQTSLEGGADLLNLMVTIRGSLLFCSSEANQKECELISNHFYACGKIDYKIVSPAQIPVVA